MSIDNRGLTDADIAGYLESLSNWGRWGAEDQLGALNYITAEMRRAAAQLVRHGEVVAISLPLPTDPGPDNPRPVQHYMITTGEGDDAVYAMDYVGLACHGMTISHVDALCHVFWGGKMYNGFPASEVKTDGAHKNAIHGARDRIVGRGVLLDIPPVREREWLEDGEAIYVEDLEAAERRQAVRVGEGDILLIRTGRHRAARASGAGGAGSPTGGLPGPHASVLPWLHERKVAALGGDGINEVTPSGFAEFQLPIHTVAIVGMGLHLMDNNDLEALAEACAAHGQYEFLFTLAPLYLQRGTGSPATGLAIL